MLYMSTYGRYARDEHKSVKGRPDGLVRRAPAHREPALGAGQLQRRAGRQQVTLREFATDEQVEAAA